MVLEDGGRGGVVEGAAAGEVGPGGDEEGGRGVGFGVEEGGDGLAGGDDDGGGFKWLDVGGVGFDDGEGVVGYGEEQLIVECSVD